MYKILIADDDPVVRELVRKYSSSSNYECMEAANGIQVLELCKKHTFDVMILDIMMPEMDGFTTLKNIRKTLGMPIILLSARGEEYDRVLGFELGADDYVVKPFSLSELMLRVGAVARRRQESERPPEKNVLDMHGLTIDFTGRLVYVDGERVDMAAKEYDLLFYLVKNRGIALTREQLISHVWKNDYYGDDRTVDTHIRRLRRRLGRYCGKIVTLRGMGYRFEE